MTAIGEALPDGPEVLTPSTAEDKDTIVCTQDVVDEFGLSNLSSLFENSAEITLACPAGVRGADAVRPRRLPRHLRRRVRRFVPLALADIPAALERGEIDCGNIFSTTPAIQTEGLIALEDDLSIVPNEAVLPLVRSEVVTPELTAASTRSTPISTPRS